MPSLILNGNKIGGTVDDSALLRYNNENSTLQASTIQDAVTELDEKVEASKVYTDEKLLESKEYSDTVGQNVKNDLLNGAGAAYDTLKELGDLIDENADALDALETIAAGKQDTIAKGSFEGDVNELATSEYLNKTVWIRNTCTNIPVAAYGWMEISGVSSNSFIQRFTTTKGAVYVRTFYNDGNEITFQTDWIKISSSEVAGVLGLENGGTGATTAANARTNLGIYDKIVDFHTMVKADSSLTTWTKLLVYVWNTYMVANNKQYESITSWVVNKTNDTANRHTAVAAELSTAYKNFTGSGFTYATVIFERVPNRGAMSVTIYPLSNLPCMKCMIASGNGTFETKTDITDFNYSDWYLDGCYPYNATAVTSTVHNSSISQKQVPTMSFMSYWNGAYNTSGSSNLAYCNKGAFGTAATKSVDTSAKSGSANLITSGAVYSGLSTKKGFDILWTRSSSITSMDATTITISSGLSSYDFIMIITSGSPVILYASGASDESYRLLNMSNNVGQVFASRNFTWTNNTTISVGKCYAKDMEAYITSYVERPTYILPHKIIGFRS